LRRIRAMTAARKLEERMLNQARELQEGALRAQERAQARQDRDRQREAIRAEAEARFPVAPPNMVTENELARMVALPVLRETAVEATECPICIEDLGEVGKTVLKCGHTLCVSCFLQQMMRATAANRAHDCKCPVCRVSYIM
jgi:hypothetical protein